jgi:hypothetical protein
MKTGRRTTTRRTTERFICEGVIASYLVEVSTLSEQIFCDRSSLEKSINHLTRVNIYTTEYTVNKKKTITTQQADPSDLLLRMLGESNSKNYVQQVTGDVLRPVHFPKYFLFHPSHRIFGHMHGALNVGKK